MSDSDFMPLDRFATVFKFTVINMLAREDSAVSKMKPL